MIWSLSDSWGGVLRLGIPAAEAEIESSNTGFVIIDNDDLEISAQSKAYKRDYQSATPSHDDSKRKRLRQC